MQDGAIWEAVEATTVAVRAIRLLTAAADTQRPTVAAVIRQPMAAADILPPTVAVAIQPHTAVAGMLQPTVAADTARPMIPVAAAEVLVCCIALQATFTLSTLDMSHAEPLAVLPTVAAVMRLLTVAAVIRPATAAADTLPLMDHLATARIALATPAAAQAHQ